MEYMMENMTWPEVKEAMEKKRPLLFIVGSVEQHGPHLPISTDLTIPVEIAKRVAEKVNGIVAPAVPYGYRSKPRSGGGERFIGTFSLSGETLIHLTKDIIKAYIQKGFSNIFVLDWHVENVEFINEGLTLAVEETEGYPRKIIVVDNPNGLVDPKILDEMFEDDFPVWDREHAAIFETSMMLYLKPDLVRQEKIISDESKNYKPYDILPPPADLVPDSGVLWHAEKASEDKGKKAADSMVDALADIIRKELG